MSALWRTLPDPKSSFILSTRGPISAEPKPALYISLRFRKQPASGHDCCSETILMGAKVCE
jgi:hypothetical protein